MNVETVIIDDKSYIEVDTFDINGNTYVYLVNEEDDFDFTIRKLVALDGKLYFDGLDTEEEFDLALMHFAKKHTNVLDVE